MKISGITSFFINFTEQFVCRGKRESYIVVWGGFYPGGQANHYPSPAKRLYCDQPGCGRGVWADGQAHREEGAVRMRLSRLWSATAENIIGRVDR